MNVYNTFELEYSFIVLLLIALIAIQLKLAMFL